LQHPAIVPIYEAGRWPDGALFYSMKRVSGRPLSELIAERRKLDERLDLIPNMIAIADAIAYAHSELVIHRDLEKRFTTLLCPGMEPCSPRPDMMGSLLFGTPTRPSNLPSIECLGMPSSLSG
jgi:serine/threonine protein kinase